MHSDPNTANLTSTKLWRAWWPWNFQMRRIREIMNSIFKLHTCFIELEWRLACINGNRNRAFGSNCFLKFTFTSFSNIYKSFISCSRSERVVSALIVLKWQNQPFGINIHAYRPCLVVKTQVHYQLFNCNMLISKPKQNLLHQHYCAPIVCHLPHSTFIKRDYILHYCQLSWSFIEMSWNCAALYIPWITTYTFSSCHKILNKCSEQILLRSLVCDLCTPLQSHKRGHLNSDGSKQ